MVDAEKFEIVTNKNKDDFRLISTEKPFEITENLKQHLLIYDYEYGTGGGIGEYFSPEKDVWCIIDENNNECGYAWWETPKENLDAKIITIAVFGEYQGNGAASIVIDFLIDMAVKIEIKQLRAQVNFIRNDIEQRVVKMLYVRGFKLADMNYIPTVKNILNEEYLHNNYSIVYLVKKLINIKRITSVRLRTFKNS